MGKIGVGNNASLVLSLMVTKCSPILQYNLEAISLCNAKLTHLCYVSNAIYAKIFKTLNKAIIADCQWHFGYLPLTFELDLKRMNFLHKLASVEQSPAQLLLMLVYIAGDDLKSICNKHGIKKETSFIKRREAVWNAFYLSLQQ